MEYNIDFYKHFAWLKKVNQQSPVNGETNQERLTRLEGDKESLVLQVSVLTDQVEAQGVKISDLESSLEEHQHKLNSTEEMLQQELLSRTSLESQKLNLMGEVSYLKLKLVDMEEKQFHGVERQHKAEVKLQELRLLKEKVDYLEDQKSQYERRLKATKAELSDLQQLLLSKNAEIDSLHTQLLARPLSTETSEREDMYRRRLNNKHQELQRLKTGMETLLVANDEKDRRIEELTLLLVQCRQFRDVVTPRQAPPTILSISNESTPSSSSEEREHGVVMRTVPSSVLPENKKTEMSFSSSSPQLVSHLPAQKERELWTHPRLVSSSMDNLQNGSSSKHIVVIPVEAEVSTENRPVDNRCQTLPVKASFPEHIGEGECSETQSQRSPEGSEDGDSRKTEKMDDTSSSDLSPQSSGAESGQRTIGSPEHLKNNNSIRKLWGKIRRTQSGGLQGEDLEPNQFRRGGLRATAGPRLTRTPESGSTVRDMNTPFNQWTREQVCGWLEDYGLGQYVNLTRQWVDNGQTLLSARPQDFEKEMGINHPLHRKKLQLALRGFSTKALEKSCELNHIWVTRWLDDIGLPQYKDQFHEGRVDGRMLQYLTVVTSQLHHLSIKCAIHVLHVNKFNPHCLRRRPGEERNPSPSEVIQWSNHRVMEWLRAVDLAEYAPNLRGSGVHGGLIILELRFSSETLAMLLNIPPQKTLLRRHLATAFTALVGTQASLEKREYANATGHAPLTTAAKVRPKKLGFTHFSHLRKRRPDDLADYICPIDSGGLSAMNGVSHRPYAGVRGLSPILDRAPERREQVGPKS
ncbi:liprin-beta-2-like isoform X1 [Oncorhynchus masou masou]|uniref:liprin-beta-2-like isoform X1 n=1 Tax=Oncorhynchus masou masou TaxID=90313 RepID=UPI0031841638